MSISEIVSALAKQGITLWTEGDKLKYKAPKGKMTDKIRDILIKNKADLV